MKKRATSKLEKGLLTVIFGYLMFMVGAGCTPIPMQDRAHSGNKLGTVLTGYLLQSIGDMHRAPSSESALRALNSLQSTVRAYEHSGAYASSNEEMTMLYEMKLLLAKKLVTPPTDNCTDAVECYQMGAPNLTLPADVVADIDNTFKKSNVLRATASAHGQLVAEISNSSIQYMCKVIPALAIGFMSLLLMSFLFLVGVELGKKEKGQTAEEKSTDTLDSK